MNETFPLHPHSGFLASHFITCSSLPNIIRMIKARRMNWAIYVICMAVKKNVCKKKKE